MCERRCPFPCVFTHRHRPICDTTTNPTQNNPPPQHTPLQNNHDNQIAAPEKFTREEARRLMALAAQHERHGWEAVAREMATGHSAIQVLIG